MDLSNQAACGHGRKTDNGLTRQVSKGSSSSGFVHPERTGSTGVPQQATTAPWWLRDVPVTADEIRATTKGEIMQIQQEFVRSASLELSVLQQQEEELWGDSQAQQSGDGGSDTPGSSGLTRGGEAADHKPGSCDGSGAAVGDRPQSSGDQRVFTGSFFYYGSPDLPEGVTPGSVEARIYNLVRTGIGADTIYVPSA